MFQQIGLYHSVWYKFLGAQMDLSITSSLALIGLLSLTCQLLGWRLRLPAILPLLIVGLLLGPGLNILNPDAIFGDVLFPLISLGVAIILFEVH